MVSSLHQVHDGQGRAFNRRAGPLPVPITALGLLTPPRASEGLVPGRFNNPILRPGHLSEVDEVLLSTAHAVSFARFAIATRPMGRPRGKQLKHDLNLNGDIYDTGRLYVCCA